MLWVPIEKLFMNEIGFDPAAVGAMAAAYAAVVPLVEIPSGILADRWSRRGVLAVASAALTLTALVGGISHDVPSYIASALLLGVYFAMYSGTRDAIVYDTVLEETGGGFEKRIGRVRAIESAALAASALAGGWLAGLTTTRTTCFLTIPFTALSIIAVLRFREPQLHRTNLAFPCAASRCRFNPRPGAAVARRPCWTGRATRRPARGATAPRRAA
jgi:MFS family permease